MDIFDILGAVRGIMISFGKILLIILTIWGLAYLMQDVRCVSDHDIAAEADYYFTQTVEHEERMDAVKIQVEECKRIINDAIDNEDYDLLEDALRVLDEIDLDY